MDFQDVKKGATPVLRPIWQNLPEFVRFALILSGWQR